MPGHTLTRVLAFRRLGRLGIRLAREALMQGARGHVAVGIDRTGFAVSVWTGLEGNQTAHGTNYLGGCHSGSGQLATDPITGAGPRDYFFDVHVYTSVDPHNQELSCKSTNAVLRIFGRNYYPYGVLVSKDDIWSFLNPATNPYIDAFYEYANAGDGG